MSHIRVVQRKSKDEIRTALSESARFYIDNPARGAGVNYYCPTEEYVHYNTIPNLVVGKIEIKVTNGMIEVSLPEGVDEGNLSAVSGTRPSGRCFKAMTLEDFKKFPHELVSETLTDDATDVKLREIFDEIDDGFDVLSPDFIIKNETNPYIHLVIEVKTVSVSSLTAMRNSLTEKINKYTGALRNRSSPFCRIVFGALIVSQNMIMTNLEFPRVWRFIVNELTYRMNVGNRVILEAERIGIAVQRPSTTLTDEEEIINEQINVISNEQIPRLFDSNIFMGEDFVNLEPRTVQLGELINEMSRKKEKMDLKTFPSTKDMFIKDKQEMENGFRIGERKTKIKPVLPLPVIIPETTRRDGVVPLDVIVYKDDSNEKYCGLFAAWCMAIRGIRSWKQELREDDKLLEEALKIDKVDYEKFEAERRSHRNKRNRVDVDKFTNQQKISLATQGVYGKKNCLDPQVKYKQKMSKTPFCYFRTQTDDIEDCINSNWWWEHEENEPVYNEMFFELARSAYDISKGPDFDRENLPGRKLLDPVSVVQYLYRTRFHRYQEFVTNLAMELIGCVKKPCNLKEFLLIKLSYFKCLVLIKPTKNTEHMFYSLLFYGENKTFNSSIGRLLIEKDGYLMTDFVSIKPWRLLNLITSAPSTSCQAAYWTWHYELNPRVYEKDDYSLIDITKSYSCYEPILDERFRRMMVLMNIIRLEDKLRTEEIMTNMRYMYMEIFKFDQALGSVAGKGIPGPRPSKIFKSFSAFPQSRLELWAIRKLVQTCEYYCMNENTKPEKIKDRNDDFDIMRLLVNHGRMNIEIEQENQEFDENFILDPLAIQNKQAILGIDFSSDRWTGLINPYIQCEEKSSRLIINLFYIGYVTNKDRAPEGNKDSKLINKAAEEELKYNENLKCNGIDEPLEPLKPHEFSPKWVNFSSQVLSTILEMELGTDFRTTIRKEFVKLLFRRSTEWIATLKASANIPESKFWDEIGFKLEDTRANRKKVVEAVAELITMFSDNPFKNFLNFLKDVESTLQGVVADLFPKPQHASFREIYVMPVKCRVIQLFLETLAITICNHFPNETMTHPENKIRTYDNHVRTVKNAENIDNYSSITFCTSADKKRWNQNFVMTSFASMLRRIVDKKLFKVVVRSLNLWSNKKIMIPKSVINLFQTAEKFYSVPLTSMKLIFCGSTRNYQMRQPRLAHLTFRTGFMQGILHYLSSLMHVAYLRVTELVAQGVLQNFSPDKCCHLINTVCSSDDSAYLVTLMWDKMEYFIPKEAMDSLSATQKAEQELSNLNLAKAVVTAFQIGYLFEEQSKHMNMISSEKTSTSQVGVFEFNSLFFTNGSLSVTAIKFLLACLNITECESFTNRFHEMHNLLTDVSSAGFPNNLITFINIGQAYLHYTSLGLTNMPTFSSYKDLILELKDPNAGFYLFECPYLPCVLGYSFTVWLAAHSVFIPKASAKDFKNKNYEINELGEIIQSVKLKPKSNFAWNKLKDKMPMNEEQLNEFLMGNNRVLFYKAQNLDEIKAKLSLKVRAPGVATSLIKRDAFCEAMESSLFITYAHCMTKSKLVAEDGIITKIEEKMSLIQYCREKIIKKRFYEDPETLDELDEDKFAGMNWAEEVEEQKRQEQLEAEDDNNLEVVPLSREEELGLHNSSIYPFYRVYEEALNLIEEVDTYSEVPVTNLRKSRSIVTITTLNEKELIPLTRCIKHFWYGDTSHDSTTLLEHQWNIYKNEISWLKDTFEETLESCPMSSPIELAFFIQIRSKTKRTFTFSGVNLRYGSLSLQLKRFCTLNYGLKDILIPLITREKEVSDVQSEHEKLLNYESKINLALMIPADTQRTGYVRKILKSIYKDHKGDLISYSPDHARLIFTSRFMNNHFKDPNLMWRELLKIKNGVYPFWLEVQKRVESDSKIRWTGPGKLAILGKSFQMVVEVNDTEILNIQVSDKIQVRNYTTSISKVLEDCGLKVLFKKVNTRELNEKRAALEVIKKGRYVGNFDGRQFTSEGKLGAPVIACNLEEVVMIPSKEIKYEIYHSELRLLVGTEVVNYEGKETGDLMTLLHCTNTGNLNFYKKQRSVKLFSLKANFNRVYPCSDLVLYFPKVNNAWESWINQTPADPDQLKSALKPLIMSHKSKPYKPSDENLCEESSELRPETKVLVRNYKNWVTIDKTKEWMSIFLSARLKHLYGSARSQLSDEATGVSFINNQMINEMNLIGGMTIEEINKFAEKQVTQKIETSYGEVFTPQQAELSSSESDTMTSSFRGALDEIGIQEDLEDSNENIYKKIVQFFGVVEKDKDLYIRDSLIMPDFIGSAALSPFFDKLLQRNVYEFHSDFNKEILEGLCTEIEFEDPSCWKRQLMYILSIEPVLKRRIPEPETTVKEDKDALESLIGSLSDSENDFEDEENTE